MIKITKELILEKYITPRNTFNFQKASIEIGLSSEAAYRILNDIIYPPICENEWCTNLVNFTSFKYGYARFCCTTCLNKSNFMKEKVSKPKKAESVKKAIKTKRERYGENLEQIVEKGKKTKEEVYGDPNYCNSNKVVETRLKNNNGVYYTEEQKKKKEDTCLERYGFKNYSSTEEGKEKKKKTLLERYGVDNIMKSKEHSRKAAKNRFETTYPHLNNGQKEKLIEQISLAESREEIMDIEKTANVSKSFFRKLVIKFSKEKVLEEIKKNRISNLEYSVRNLLEKFNSIFNDKTILNGKEIDILINNIGIEINGDYWHSTNFKEKNYHQIKKLAGLEKGINILFITEHSFSSKKDIWESVILSKLGISERIYARKTIIKEISPNSRREFLNETHLQGDINSKVNLGLFYEDDLISVMTFGKPRFNKNYEWELLRFSNALGITVIGGASKLLKYFEKKYTPKNLLSYANLNWSDGNLYNTLGFEKIEITEPNYVYIKRNEVFTRYQAQKHKLKNLLGDKFDENLSETENMVNAGFLKIYDCGNISFKKNYI